MIKSNISDVAVRDVRIKCGDSVLNRGRIVKLFAGLTRFTDFCQRIFCSRSEAVTDAISGKLVWLIIPMSV